MKNLIETSCDLDYMEGFEAAKQLGMIMSASEGGSGGVVFLVEALGDLIDVPLSMSNMRPTVMRLEGFAAGVFDQDLFGYARNWPASEIYGSVILANTISESPKSIRGQHE